MSSGRAPPGEGNVTSFNWVIPTTLNGHTINGTDYKIKWVAWDDSPNNIPNADFSNNNLTIQPPLLPTPTGLTAVAMGPTAIEIQWNDVISAGDYFLERSNTSPTGGFTQIAILPQDDTSYTDDNLVVAHINPGTTYYYRVRANTGGIYSNYSTVATVTTPNVGLFPDLAIQPSDLALVPEGASQRVNATVHNIGQATATNVLVRFFNSTTSTVLANVMIPSLAAGASGDVFALWAPSNGASVTVSVDPLNAVEELSNSNNSAQAVFNGASGRPIIAGVSAEWDGDDSVHMFGRYVSGVQLLNTFTANVLDPDGSLNLHHVTFEFGPLGSATDTNILDGWTAIFDVGQLTGDATLTVIAYDTNGNASDPWTGTVHVVPLPGWITVSDADDVFVNGQYHLIDTSYFAEIAHTIDPDWWVIGGSESSFRLGIQFGIVADLNAAHDVALSYDEFLEATILGGVVNLPATVGLADQFLGSSNEQVDFADNSYKLRWDRLTGGSWGPVSFSFFPLFDGDLLSLTGLSGELQVHGLALSDLMDYLVAQHYIPTNPFKTEAIAYTIPVPIGPVVWPARVSLGLELDVTIDAAFNFGYDVIANEFQVLDGSFFEATVLGVATVFGGLGIPFLSAGLEVGLNLGVHYRTQYDAPLRNDFLWGSLQVNPRLVATAGEKHTLVSWMIPGEGEDPWVFGNAPLAGSSQVFGGGANGILLADVLPWPSVAHDDAGNVLFTRIIDLDTDSGKIDPEVFYAIRNAAGVWSPLDAVALNDMIDSDPEAAFDGNGGAVAVWVANTIDPADVEATPWEVYLTTQEICSAYWNGTAWSTPQVVTSDSISDGGPEVAFHAGYGLMLWEHAGGANATDLGGFEIVYALWDDVTKTWGSPLALTADMNGDWAPTLAFDRNGNAIAVWVHDDDGDPTTMALRYSVWNGSSWSLIDAVASTPGTAIREPRVAFDSNGNALLAWLANEGAEDILYTSVWNSTTDTWSSPQSIDDSPHFMEGLDLAISSTDVAMLVWHGWDGQHDLFSTIRELGADRPWTPATRLTDTVDGEWMASTTFDSFGQPVTVWANESTTTVFGEGADGLELTLAPDLVAQTLELDSVSLTEGDMTRLSLTVSNLGWQPSIGAEVWFYLGDPDLGGTQLGSTSYVGVLDPRASMLVFSEPFSLPSGSLEYFAIITPTPAELNSSNNAASLLVEVAPLDAAGPQVSLINTARGEAVTLGTRMLTLLFSEPVGNATAEQFTLIEDTLGFVALDHIYQAADGRSFYLVVEGGLPVVGSNGSYTLQVLPSVVDTAGNPLNDGVPEIFAFDVVDLPGDYNFDGDVDAKDYSEWKAQYGEAVDSPADGNRDGIVDAADYTVWRNNLGVTLFPPEPPELLGDYNEDRSVDAADYTVWRNTLGSFDTRYSGADGDGNGIIQSGDYDVWKANYGKTFSPGSAAVPAIEVQDEPAATNEHAHAVLGLKNLPSPPNTIQHVLPLDGFRVVTSTSLSRAPSRPLRQYPQLKALSPQKDLLAIWLDSSAGTRHIAANSEMYFGLGSADERDNILFEAVDQAFDDFGAALDQLLHF